MMPAEHLTRPFIDSCDHAAAGCWSPCRAVVGFGVVRLSADMIYEGARSTMGAPYGVSSRVGCAGRDCHRRRRGDGLPASFWPFAAAAVAVPAHSRRSPASSPPSNVRSEPAIRTA
jgi:hypothetical protein